MGFYIHKTFHLQNFSLKVENVKEGWIHLLLLWSFWLPIIRIDFHRASSIKTFIMDTVWELISLSGNHHTRLRSNRDLICCQVDELMFFSSFTVCYKHTHPGTRRGRLKLKVSRDSEECKVLYISPQDSRLLKYSESFSITFHPVRLFKKSLKWNQ